MIAWLRRALSGHLVLIGNTIAVAGSTAINAGLGFVYWWLAARTMPPEAVGGASALVSAMSLVGLFSEAGFGTLLAGETQSYGERASGIIWAAVTSSTLIALFGGAVLSRLVGDVGGGALWFIAGCALTSASLVLDQASVGLLRSFLQLSRNIVFSCIKLGLLGMVALGGGKSATAMVGTWVVGLAVSIVWVLVYAARLRLLRPCWPDFRLLFASTGKLFGHHALNMAVQAPSLILPLLVSLSLSPAINAAFYAGWMVLTIAAMLPGAMTLVLYTMGAHNTSYKDMLRFSVAMSMAFSLLTGLLFMLLPRLILGLFNPAYPSIAASSLQWFGLGLLGLAVKCHYLLLARLGHWIQKATFVFIIGCVLEVALALFGSWADGLRGLTIGWVLGLLFESTLMLPALRAALR